MVHLIFTPFEKGGWGDLKIFTEAPNPLKGVNHQIIKDFLSLKSPL
jgi:hypothetical protein